MKRMSRQGKDMNNTREKCRECGEAEAEVFNPECPTCESVKAETVAYDEWQESNSPTQCQCAYCQGLSVALQPNCTKG